MCKKKIFFGRGIDINTLKSDYIYVAEENQIIVGVLYADTTKSGSAILFAIEVLEENRKIELHQN